MKNLAECLCYNTTHTVPISHGTKGLFVEPTECNLKHFSQTLLKILSKYFPFWSYAPTILSNFLVIKCFCLLYSWVATRWGVSLYHQVFEYDLSHNWSAWQRNRTSCMNKIMANFLYSKLFRLPVSLTSWKAPFLMPSAKSQKLLHSMFLSKKSELTILTCISLNVHPFMLHYR